jgi:glycosyltransferase involved in cell wall biosynthesis
MGGVVNYIGVLIDKLSDTITFSRLYIGSTIEKQYGIVRVLKPLKDGFRLMRMVNNDRYDVIQINPSLDLKSVLRDGFFMLILKFFGLKNILLFFRGWDEKFEKKIKKNAINKFFFRWVFANVGNILVLSSVMKEALISIGFENQRIQLTTTMFNNDIFCNQQPQFNRPPRRLIFMARIVKDKGIYELLNAVLEITKTHRDVELSIVGDGPERENVEVWVKKHGISYAVSFPGYLRTYDKGKALIESDIFILPSYTEGCPNSMVEAMGSGCAIIATPVGGIPDIVEDTKNCLFVNVKNSDEIATAIKKLMDDAELTKKMRKNNFYKAHEQFESRKVSEKIYEVYRYISNKT